MTSEVDAGDFAVRFPTNIPLYCVAVWQMAAEGQTDKIASDMEVAKKQRREQNYYKCSTRALVQC